MANESDSRRGNQEATDLRLARAVRDLPREMEPSRDLWAGIERNIIDYPQPAARAWHRQWQTWGVAASLVIAVSALVIALTGANQPAEPRFVGYGESINQLESEYLQVRNPMMEEFNETNQNLDPVVRADIYQNIEIMAMARRELEAQVRANPGNRRLVEMLMRIHEQELELLKQDYTQPRSM